MYDLRQILEILCKYCVSKSNFISAEHDVIYFPISPGKVSSEDLQSLKEIHCHPDWEQDVFYHFV